MSKADHYLRLFSDFNRIDRQMQESPQDGQQRELMDAARAVVRFEIEHELPKLKELVLAHGSAISGIEAAKQKLSKLHREIASHESYIETRFAEHDVTAACLDFLAWRQAVKFGERAISRLDTIAAVVEVDLKDFVKGHPGLSDCLDVERKHGWDPATRESFSWLYREQAHQTANAQAEQQAA